MVKKKRDQVKRRNSKKIAMNDVASSTSTPRELGFPSGTSSSGTSYSQLMRQGAFSLLSSHATYYFGPSNGSPAVMPMTDYLSISRSITILKAFNKSVEPFSRAIYKSNRRMIGKLRFLMLNMPVVNFGLLGSHICCPLVVNIIAFLITPKIMGVILQPRGL
ncbi:hypothetical protein Cgig2_027279 [Carnegiea gigantea]|uniref:Uncharacterized protein n=1 Tax=Carnegiea gigantea TaxID=171969 RepID=A0A9Q1QBL2_9CARY|nr:hypothetical protein Cgig2_027279 [Carnegiea gigantea]